MDASRLAAGGPTTIRTTRRRRCIEFDPETVSRALVAARPPPPDRLSRPRASRARRRPIAACAGSCPTATSSTSTISTAPRDAPLVVLFHGLEGSSRSHYAVALMHALCARAAGVAPVPHFRGCSGEPNRLPRAYHSGDADEIGRMLQRFVADNGAPVFAAGVSLGGNALLKWLGREGEGARAAGSRRGGGVRAARPRGGRRGAAQRLQSALHARVPAHAQARCARQARALPGSVRPRGDGARRGFRRLRRPVHRAGPRLRRRRSTTGRARAASPT